MTPVMVSRLAVFLAPFLFVFLWSTGFIGAKYAAPYAEPLTTLSLRFAGAIAVFLAWSAVARAPGLTWRQAAHAFGIGALLHGTYLGGVFIAIDLGLPSGPSALIVSLQPALTAIFAAAMVSEPLNGRRWLGILLGFLGVGLVTGPKLTGPEGWPVAGILFCIGSLVAITLASAWQKRVSGSIDLRTGGVWQYCGGLAVVLPLALLFEDQVIAWTPELAFALFWMIIILSLGAVSLYMALLARGSLVATASLMYLVPAVTALIAFPLFGERLYATQLVGLVVAAVGVALVTRRSQSPHS